MKNIAIITARGGSKRIPRKNIKDFLGKPIIAYPIQAAIDSKLFDEVIVSTDDNEIAEISLALGASVPFMRSKKNSDDYSGTFDVLDEVVKELEEKGTMALNICCIYPTSPFLTSELLTESYALFDKGEFDSLLPVVAYDFAPQRALKVNAENRVFWVNPEHALTRSQDLENHFHDIGQFYWLKNETIKNHKKIITKNTGYFEVESIIAQDIDTPEDWEIAEVKFKYKHELF